MSATAPHRLRQLRTTEFMVWLANGGAEVLPNTNPYEVIRYRAFQPEGGARPKLHILYRRENDTLTWTGDTRQHYEAFLAGTTLATGPATVKAAKKSKTRAEWRARIIPELIERDGGDCWFCAEPLHDDVTLEHLVPRAAGGKDHKSNLVLAHRTCNAAAADKMIVEKLAMRRSKVSA